MTLRDSRGHEWRALLSATIRDVKPTTDRAYSGVFEVDPESGTVFRFFDKANLMPPAIHPLGQMDWV